MPLTPQDVADKRFTPTKLREGYNMEEVDAFLDEVEKELERLLAENDDLRSKVGALGAGPASGETGTDAGPGESGETDSPTTPQEPAAAQDGPTEDTAPASPAPTTASTTPEPRRPLEEIRVTTAAEASSAATRLLELATRNAEEVLTEAQAEAEQLRSAARADAERTASESQARTEQLEQEARTRAQNLDSETESRRTELFGDLERERARLDGEVENLRAFEREYRSRLRSYFTEQLEALDGHGESGLGHGGLGEDDQGPRRLRSIEGDEAEDDQNGAPQGGETPVDGEPGQPGEEHRG